MLCVDLLKSVETYDIFAPPELNDVKQTPPPSDNSCDVVITISSIFLVPWLKQRLHSVSCLSANDVAQRSVWKSSSDEYCAIEGQYEGAATSEILAQVQKANPTLAVLQIRKGFFSAEKACCNYYDTVCGHRIKQLMYPSVTGIVLWNSHIMHHLPVIWIGKELGILHFLRTFGQR